MALAANGEFLLIDGRHRLILAQLLGLKKIPVVVNLLAESVAQSLIDGSDALGERLIDSTALRRSNPGLTTSPSSAGIKKVLQPGGFASTTTLIRSPLSLSAVVRNCRQMTLKVFAANCFIPRLSNA